MLRSSEVSSVVVVRFAPCWIRQLVHLVFSLNALPCNTKTSKIGALQASYSLANVRGRFQRFGGKPLRTSFCYGKWSCHIVHSAARLRRIKRWYYVGVCGELFKVTFFSNSLCAVEPLPKEYGGEDRIRTCGGFAPTHAFQACPLSRSGTSPLNL